MSGKRTPEDIKKGIRQAVGELYASGAYREPFHPGTTRVKCSGRVFDEDEIVSLVDSALEFWLTAGRFARRFEDDFSAFVGAKHTLLVNSGSSANLLAITALTSPILKKRQLRPGDEVITTAAAFPTTVNPIVQNQLVPVFVDIDIPSYNIAVAAVEKAITKRTKAVFCAHTLGNPFDITALRRICRRHGLYLIEDACDALGSRYRDAYVGTRGDIGTFSFYPAHHITMGEGGALVTDSPRLSKIIQSFRDWGRDCWCDPGRDNSCGKRFTRRFGKLPYGYDHKYVYSHVGYNLKVTDLQAAIGVAQLRKLPRFIRQRRLNYARLYEGLKKYEEFLLLPQSLKVAQPSWFGFLISVKENRLFDKNRLVRYLEEHKIATRLVFAGNITKQPAYSTVSYRVAGTLVNTDYVMKNTFWIGVYPGIDEDQIRYVLAVFARFFSRL